MRKSITKITTDINKQFSEIHHIVNLISKKNSQSIIKINDWLYSTEKLLQNLNLPESSKFSVKRGELSSFIPSSTGNKKKEHLQLASQLLTQAQHDLWDTYSIYATKLENASTLINQLLSVIYQTKGFSYNKNEDFTLFLNRIWDFCAGHEQLKGICTQILLSINKSDVIIIMADKIALENL
ncbi:hypothetical protein [Tenacibaculum aestuariivivum]|uniref:hypothetical protein n=1 Tax=Tenacibaculum aestuariivivum TaxID=2006131 RepID=UPI003AB68C14